MIETKVNKPLENINYTQRRAVYGLLKNEKNEIATIQTIDGNFFLPGGGLEEGESLEECLKREFLEEVGFTVSIKKPIEVISYFFFCPKFKIHMENKGYFFQCEYIDTKILELPTVHKLVWLPFDEAIGQLCLLNQSYAVKLAFRE